jgi:hypothetical protein
MTKDSGTASAKMDRGYFKDIGIIIVLGVLLWSIIGFVGGYIPFDIHEWGMGWMLVVIFVLPVIVVIALIVAVVVPLLAGRWNYGRPRWLAKVIVSLWFLISFILIFGSGIASASQDRRRFRH